MNIIEFFIMFLPDVPSSLKESRKSQICCLLTKVPSPSVRQKLLCTAAFCNGDSSCCPYRTFLHGYTDRREKYSHLKERTMTLAELSDSPWVSLTSEAITRIFLNTYFAKQGLLFEPAIELATTNLILPAIEHNLGIGFLPPEFAKEALDTGSVLRIHIPDELPHRTISLVYDSEYPQSVASTAFRKFLLQEFAERNTDQSV